MSQERRDPGRRIRVVLAEDDEPVRQRLAQMIEGWTGMELAGVCETLAETLVMIETRPMDLLITDLKLPDGNGIEAIRLLSRRQPHAQTMVISVLADEKTVLDAIAAGATGYLLKDADPPDLVEAIADLMAGRSPISSSIARVLVRRLSEDGKVNPSTDAPSLTAREMDILWGIAKGFTYGELAERLGISHQTVPVHIRNIYRKLQVSNRSEAVYEAARLGLIRL